MTVCRLRVAMLDAKIGNSNSNPRFIPSPPPLQSLDFPSSIRARIPIIVISNSNSNSNSNSKSIQSVEDDDSSSSEISSSSRVCVQLIPILNEEHFNQTIAHHSSHAIVILWMASWCRKCIYLKPKLEKMAADYFPRICFYSVDVNAVPHKLVTMANVSKMPTIQVWKDKKKQGEVIGGHKAYLVVNEVCDIIDNVNGDSA